MEFKRSLQKIKLHAQRHAKILMQSEERGTVKTKKLAHLMNSYEKENDTAKR